MRPIWEVAGARQAYRRTTCFDPIPLFDKVFQAGRLLAPQATDKETE